MKMLLCKYIKKKSECEIKCFLKPKTTTVKLREAWNNIQYTKKARFFLFFESQNKQTFRYYATKEVKLVNKTSA